MFTLAIDKYPNADAAAINLLKELSADVTPDAVVAELEKHPDYPSLLSISDVLNNFNIENSAFRLHFDELTAVPTPFIAHTLTNGNDFVLVKEITNGHVLFANEKGERQKTNIDRFKEAFGGVVLTAEPLANAKKIKFAKKTILSEAKSLLIAVGLLLIFIVAILFHSEYFTNYNWQILLLSAFKTVGLITSILLLVQSVDRNNPLIQKICQSGSKTNCNAILSSNAAKVFEGLTWSEVGFFYFAGTCLAVFFGNHSSSLMQTLAILNIISLPYTFYSIYYQARVAKQWCILCCIVQALLWLEFIPSVTAFESRLSLPNTAEWSTLLIDLLLPVILWASLKPLFLRLQQLNPLKQQLRKFKYNQELFNKLLQAQPKFALPDENWSIILGNKEARHSITMVTNPYCPPCSKMHKILDELLDQRSDIQARIVFTANNTDENIKTPVSRHLMALNELTDKTIVKKALDDWYEQKQKDYQAWVKVYPTELREADFYKLDKQKAWCKIAEVTATPTILLNGYRLPELYQLPDLKYLLE